MARKKKVEPAPAAPAPEVVVPEAPASKAPAGRPKVEPLVKVLGVNADRQRVRRTTVRRSAARDTIRGLLEGGFPVVYCAAGKRLFRVLLEEGELQIQELRGNSLEETLLRALFLLL